MNNKKRAKLRGELPWEKTLYKLRGYLQENVQTDSFPWEKTLLKWVNNKIERRIRDNKLK